LTHLGVDPALPPHETKHVVLTNQYALFVAVCGVLSILGSEDNALLPEVQVLLGIATVVTPLTLALNALGRSTLASLWLLGWFAVVMGRIAMLEPVETQHAGFLMLNAAVSFFLFAPTQRRAAWAITIPSGLAAIALPSWLAAHPAPTPLPGFDVAQIALGNQTILLVALVFYCARSAAEMARVERELVEERKKRESLLRREVAHQVAERSRELGAALTRTDGPITPASLAARFGARYQLVRSLGEGGMGAVFEVERKTDGQHLALKVMTGETSREHAARFAREAEIGARIHDPHVVEIIDVGVAEGGAPFLVMELVSGGSLEQQRKRFGDPTWALPILRDVARGLLALHGAGVVHRDLKPANVLLDDRGAAKVSDFGIARFGFAGTGVDASAPTAVAALPGGPLTGTGAWIGTPLYMAPEAARGGRDVAAPADLFALGLLAYELVSGRQAFATPAVLLALADQPLPTPRAIDGVSKDARDAIFACLEADPARRPTIARFLAALG
jgi:hypothetical protein